MEKINFATLNWEKDPITQFEVLYQAHFRKLEQVLGRPPTDNATRVTIATSTKDGTPSLRYVLLKQHDNRGFIINTHYTSRKGRDLIENPKASLCFYWKQLDVQVRVDADVKKLSSEESDANLEGQTTRFSSGVGN
ncbi:pyridoxine/pyridoxamine 5'- phosphate oxidase [Acrasis kona]|uniref:pyridoxal 5'-phosphate synthase n=1 Tax=Acrasis kona TaxID=1008807 RepID=A0AAW2ZIY8_9EUKA